MMQVVEHCPECEVSGIVNDSPILRKEEDKMRNLEDELAEGT